MTESTQRPPVIERFYKALDEKTDQELTSEQKQAIEQAVLMITLASRHRIDVRKSVPFFGQRYYLVFLFGRDLRQRLRKQSTLFRILMTLLLMLSGLFCMTSVLLALYMIKSALGIDILEHFHVGIWDWWCSL